jgi:hypothetical protein
LTTEKTTKPPLQQVMTVGELADLLQSESSVRLRPSAVYRLLRRGAVPAFKTGSNWYFNRESISKCLREPATRQ